jgi:hypothetical protein
VEVKEGAPSVAESASPALAQLRDRPEAFEQALEIVEVFLGRVSHAASISLPISKIKCLVRDESSGRRCDDGAQVLPGEG